MASNTKMALAVNETPIMTDLLGVVLLEAIVRLVGDAEPVADMVAVVIDTDAEDVGIDDIADVAAVLVASETELRMVL